MLARVSWVWILCLAGALAIADEPAGPEAPRQSQVPHRRVRRTYDHKVQIHQPGTEAEVAPPEKEKFVPGGAQPESAPSNVLLTEPLSSPSPPPRPVVPRTEGEEEGEEKEDKENDLWILKTPNEVLGVETNKSVSSILGGWVGEEMESRNRAEENAKEEDGEEPEPDEEGNPGPVNLLTVREAGPASLLARVASFSSNAADRVRSSSEPEHSDSSSGREPATDRFAPRPEPSLERVVLIRDSERAPDSPPVAAAPPASALPRPAPEAKPEEPATARIPAAGVGTPATKWEPPAFSTTRAPDSSAGSYGRVGAIFGPEPPSRAPSSLGLPPPTSGFGSGPAPLPDSRFKSFGTPGPLLPPLQTGRPAGPSRPSVQPFLPGRYDP